MVFKPCAQGTKHFIALTDVPAFPEPSALLHTGGHPSSGMFLLHWGIGQSKLKMRQGETGSRVQHLQPAWLQGWDLPQACSPCHVSLCCLEGVCFISVSRPCTFLSSRKAPDAIGRQGLCSLPEEAAGSGRGLARSNVHLLLVILAWPQVLVPSAVRSGGQVIGPDQWNVAGGEGATSMIGRLEHPHPHPHPHLHPRSKILVLFPV